jgi:PAS domain-containing protein
MERYASLSCELALAKPRGLVIGASWDFTKWNLTEIALMREHYLMSALMDNLPHLIYFKDRESRFIAANRSMLVRAGFRDESGILE